METRPICIKCGIKPVEKHFVYKGKQYYRKTCEACRRQRPQYILRIIMGLGKNPHKCERCDEQFLFNCEVHHLDRDRSNHRTENLKVLCPNCHTLTHFEKDTGA